MNVKIQYLHTSMQRPSVPLCLTVMQQINILRETREHFNFFPPIFIIAVFHSFHYNILKSLKAYMCVKCLSFYTEIFMVDIPYVLAQQLFFLMLLLSLSQSSKLKFSAAGGNLPLIHHPHFVCLRVSVLLPKIQLEFLYFVKCQHSKD